MSTFRSRMISTGLEGVVYAFCVVLEKRLSFELRTWSRSFRSSLVAIILASSDCGHRMMGTEPIVTLTLNSPLTILSTAASCTASSTLALLKVQYDSLPIPKLNRSGLSNNEVEILVVDLCYAFGRVCGGNLGGEVFEELSGDGGDEVDVGWAVQASSKVGAYRAGC